MFALTLPMCLKTGNSMDSDASINGLRDTLRTGGMQPNLTPEETISLIVYARQKFAEERSPLAPALRPIRLLLARLAPSTKPVPPPKPPGELSLALRKKRRR